MAGRKPVHYPGSFVLGTMLGGTLAALWLLADNRRDRGDAGSARYIRRWGLLIQVAVVGCLALVPDPTLPMSLERAAGIVVAGMAVVEHGRSELHPPRPHGHATWVGGLVLVLQMAVLFLAWMARR